MKCFSNNKILKGIVKRLAKVEAVLERHLRKKNLCSFIKFNLSLCLENESILKKIHFKNSIY
jgi:hypothetical protein